MKQLSRRDILRAIGSAAVAGPILSALGCGDAAIARPDDAACLMTNDDPYGLGPFFRAGAPDRPELAPAGAAGEALAIQGVVYGRDCRTPLAGAVVDVWHADNSGIYDEASPEFWYRGRFVTGDDGTYAFTSIYPGAYNLGARFRPHHIHYRVAHPANEAELITQLYFEGDPYLANDPGDEPSRTIALTLFEGRKHGVFDVVLNVAV